MSYTPEQSAIKLTAEQEAHLATLDVEQIKAFMASVAIENGLVVPDIYDASILLPVEHRPTPQPQRFAKTITVNGQKHILEGKSELELEKAESAFYREQFQQPNATTEALADETPRDDRGRFVSRTDDPVAKAELELKFKRGEIDTATYLAESGAIDFYLASQGISLRDVQKVAEQSSVADWKSATDQFLEAHPDWVGGAANLDEIGKTLQALKLDGEPSLESLEAAHADMQRRNAIHDNPELRAQQEMHSNIADARSAEEIRDALGRSSSWFGR